MGANLVLVARREEQLKEVAAEVERAHGVTARIVAMDLSTPDAPQRLYDQLQADGVAVDVLVNNAGFGLHGPFLDIPWEREQNMLELDIVTLVHMTKLFTKAMVSRNFGYVCQVSSIGAYQPTPTYASYSAAKAFVLSFGEALNYELRGTGVKVSVVSPGVTATEFLAVSGQKPTLYQRMVMMKSPDVVRIALDAMLKGTPSVVPGFVNAVSAWSNRLIPRKLSTIVAERLMT
jgi:short-subunit dehydrogenase